MNTIMPLFKTLIINAPASSVGRLGGYGPADVSSCCHYISTDALGFNCGKMPHSVTETPISQKPNFNV